MSLTPSQAVEMLRSDNLIGVGMEADAGVYGSTRKKSISKSEAKIKTHGCYYQPRLRGLRELSLAVLQ